MADVLNGLDYLIYLGVTAPSSAFDSGDANYDVCGEVMSMGVSDAVNVIETSSKTTAGNSSFLGGRHTQTLNVTARFDAAGDAGQDHIQTALEATNKRIYFLITDDVATHEEWYGQAILESQDFTLDDQAATEVSFMLRVTGAATRGTVT